MIKRIDKLKYTVYTWAMVLCLMTAVVTAADKVDMVIFSYKRPLQLYALLESLEKYAQGLGEIRVVYRSSEDDLNSAYQAVQDAFPSIYFIKQSDNFLYDFKPLVL